jgi:hypothetical protein
MRSLTLLLIVASLLLLAPPALAQFANADLAGTVTDSDGAPLPGVTITATNTSTNRSRTTVSSANGTYAVNGLRPGLYDISFLLEGFQTVEREAVTLRVGQETRVNAELQVGTVEEEITVTSTAPVIETTSKEIGGTLTTEEFESLPTQNRSALLFASLFPGVVPAPSTESTASDALFVNGQDDNNNSFNFDGANNDDDVIGARAGAQARVPMEAIQEFQVLTTQFDAEFGRSMGGVFNAITKSGGNQFAGSVFHFIQDASYNNKNFFTIRNGLQQPETSYRSSGFTLGGPMVRDKAFFFVSYEDDLNEEGITQSFSSRPDLNFTTTENNDIDNTMLKVDYQPAQNHQLAARYLQEKSPQFNQIIGNVTEAGAREEDDTDSSWVFSVDSVANPRSFNIFRVSFTKEDVSFANPGFNNNGQNFEAQRNQSPSEARPDFTDGASVVAQSRINRSTQVDDTFSYFLPEWKGEHEFRFGFQYSDREEIFTNFGTLNGQFNNFETDAPFNPNDIGTYPGAFTIRVLGGLTAPIPKNKTLGVFVQDDWRLTDRLTLNLGVRYDDEDITDGAYIAPRLGFAWDPLGKGTTVVRGGYGRFYDRFQLGFFSSFFLDAVDLSQGFLLRVPDSGQNQQFFFDLAQANGVATLTELRDLLVGLFEGGATAPLNIFPTVDNPDRTQGYLDSLTLGVEHEVWPGISAGIDLIHNEARDIPLLVDLNPFSAAQGGRPNISILNGEQVDMGSISTWVNAGENTYDAVQLSLQKRTGRWNGRISLTLANSEGNNQGGGGGTGVAYFQRRTETGYNFDTGEIIGQPLDLGFDDPRGQDIPVNWNRDTNLSISGQYRVPHTSWRDSGGLTIAGLFRYMTGEPVTLLENSLRLDNNNRALLPSGTYDAGVDSDIAQNGTGFNGKIGGAQDPDFRRMDLSLRYLIPISDRFDLEVLSDIFNVFDTVNYSSIGGTRAGLSNFLVPQGALNPRQYQFGVKFRF